MNKRSYNRRTEEQIISDLQGRIQKLEQRVQAKRRQDSPVLREIPKVKRLLAKFAQTCVDHERGDVANTTLGFLATLDQQARQTPASTFSRGAFE